MAPRLSIVINGSANEIKFPRIFVTHLRGPNTLAGEREKENGGQCPPPYNSPSGERG